MEEKTAKLKAAVKKYGLIALALVMTAGVCLLFCMRKQGFFIDEVYTYGLSNSMKGPYLTDIRNGNLIDSVISREEIADYLSAGSEDAFRFGFVTKNLERDVHPPLYYWIFHAVSSFFPGSDSKWIGLGINAVLFLLTTGVLCALCTKLYGSTEVAAAAAGLYGLSVLGLSTVMMIRMYMLLTFFTVLLAWTVARIVHRPQKKGSYALLTAVIFCGMMTQYYFVFYAFFICAAYDIYALAQKRYRSFIWFSLCALVGVGLMICAFPACLKQMFEGNGQAVGGMSVADALLDFATYGERLDHFTEKARLMLRGMTWTAAAAGICLLLCLPKAVRALRERKIPLEALVVLLPLPATYILTVLIAPLQAQELRYIYNLTPIAAAGTGFLLCISEKSTGSFRFEQWVKKGAVLLILAAALWNARAMPPATLFTAQREYEAATEAYADVPCVYLADGPRIYGPLTQDLPELKNFRNFFVTNNTASPALKEYLGNADRAVLYISTNDYWTDGYGFDADAATEAFGKDTGLTACEPLYIYDFEGQGGLSAVYLMKG